SKSIKRVIPIRGRQQFTPKARSKATRVDLRHLGLGLGKINPVTVKHCVVSATSTVRPSGGLALRDNRLRRRHRVYSALVKHRRLSRRLFLCRQSLQFSRRLFLYRKPSCH
ncbi:hypothetical protein GGI10_000759, partial [Coemansia sp. RSA 2530]